MNAIHKIISIFLCAFLISWQGYCFYLWVNSERKVSCNMQGGLDLDPALNQTDQDQD